VVDKVSSQYNQVLEESQRAIESSSKYEDERNSIFNSLQQQQKKKIGMNPRYRTTSGPLPDPPVLLTAPAPFFGQFKIFFSIFCIIN
jgi:hypothetical protein